MSDYLDELIHLARRSEIFGNRNTSINSIANLLGSANETPKNYFEAKKIWAAYNADPLKLSELGITLIQDKVSRTIGFNYKGEAYVVVPFLPNTPILDWNDIHLRCPECMLLIKNLD